MENNQNQPETQAGGFQGFLRQYLVSRFGDRYVDATAEFLQALQQLHNDIADGRDLDSIRLAAAKSCGCSKSFEDAAMRYLAADADKRALAEKILPEMMRVSTEIQRAQLQGQEAMASISAIIDMVHKVAFGRR